MDNEEKEILEAFTKGKLKRSKGAKALKAEAEAAAGDYFRKDTRITIRLSSHDLRAVKRRAALEGLPYQTMLAGIIHKFAAESDRV